MSVVQSFHLTLLVPQASLHLLSGHGFGQVQTLSNTQSKVIVMNVCKYISVVEYLKHHTQLYYSGTAQRLAIYKLTKAINTKKRCQQTTRPHPCYLNSDHSSWFKTIWSIWNVSVQTEKVWVRIIGKTFTLRDRQ